MNNVALVDFDYAWTEDHPSEPGWYATVHCWEPWEGGFGDAHYWDGKQWADEDGHRLHLPIGHFAPVRFATYAEAEADAFADANNLGW